MAINGTVMIQASAVIEYGVLVTNKAGISRIYHLNKVYDLLNPQVKKYVTARANSMASGKHYFVTAIADNPPKDLEISIVEINCNKLRETMKWDASRFQDAYIDFHTSVNGQPGAELRKVNGLIRLPTVDLPSFVEFMREAFPNDYNRWKMLESDLRWVRETFSIPTLR